MHEEWRMMKNDEEWCIIWSGIDLLIQNWHEEFDEFWPEHLKISNICPLMGLFWPKYIMFELKKYKGVMFDGTEDWCKIWKKLTCAFKNDIWNLANFHRLKNLGSFIECSGHIFVGHDSCFRILQNHIMKIFQVKHS